MQFQLFREGIVLMLVGMGVVFVFLTALVAATALMSRLVTRLTPAAMAPAADPAEIAAITAAIARHRGTHGPQQR